MVFNSLHFLWFFVVVYALYRLLPHRAQNWLLLVASYYFYASWDWRFLGLLLASTIVDYSCGRLIEASPGPRRRKTLLCLSLGFNLTLLGFFKYFNFFADNLHGLFGALGWQLDFVTLRVAAACRHLVLHVRHDELCHRRVPARDSGDARTCWTSPCSSRTSHTWWQDRSSGHRSCSRRSTTLVS